MAAVVFLLTGFVPRHRFRTHRRWIVGSVAMTAMCALAVTLILTPRFIEISGRAHDLKIATQTITGLLGSGSRLSHIAISGGTVRADITGEVAPPPVGDVAATLSRALGYPVTAQLGWIPVQDPEHVAKEPPQLPLSDLSPEVEKWLVPQSLTLRGLSYQSGTLVISAAGPFPPESSDELARLISARFKQDIPVSMAWTHAPGAAEPSDAETALASARETTVAWASTNPDTEVLSISGDGTPDTITVTLIGSTKPDIGALQSELRTNLPQTTIAIQWVSGGLLLSDSPEIATDTTLTISKSASEPTEVRGPPR